MTRNTAQRPTVPGRQQISPDICVIGAGAGGLAAASAAAAFGVNVVLIEQAKTGGTLARAALSSKALLSAAERAQTARSGGRAVRALRFGGDFAGVRDHVRGAIAAVAPQDARERVNGLGVRVIEGIGRFTDPSTAAADGFDITARRFVVATGSSPVVPAIPGLAAVPFLTEETVFGLAECPRHLIIIGAGAAGLELAQAFRRLGAAVTVLEAEAPFSGEDAECSDIVLDALVGEGVVIRWGVSIVAVRRALARLHVDIATADGTAIIEGSHIMVAAGRRPNLEALDLDAAGIRHRPDGIEVDRRLRTSNKRVYAIGDVIGRPRLAHLAHHQAGLAIRHALFRSPVRADRLVVPRVIYTDPELAQVGLTEDEARDAIGVIRVLRSPYRENDRAVATGTTEGHIKIVTNRRGEIVGVTIVGAGAAENIAAWTLAIDQRLNIEALAGVIVPYPSFAEVGKRAAMTYFTRGLTSPLVRRIIGWLRRFD